jgi:DUF3089 family protein
MQHGGMPRSILGVGLQAKMVAAIVAAAVVISGLAAASAAAVPAGTVWLCKPGLANNPCEKDLTATIEFGNGASFVQKSRPANHPPIDCFYVYPTVSSQFTTNANLTIDPEETQIAIDQASRFSQVCKVYAPMYPQVTLIGLLRGEFTPTAIGTAYAGVLSAWEDYLANYNHGRGVVLIGHSQGAGMLIQLMRNVIDPNSTLRQQLVSALLMGGNVIVPSGQLVGGDFQHVPACQFALQTHCVVAYSSFLTEPPEGAFFGRLESPVSLLGGGVPAGINNPQVLCVNPTLFFQGERAGALLPYESTTPFPGLLGGFIRAPNAPTPWVGTPRQYSAQCEQANGASWLQVTNVGPPEDPREQVIEVLGPLWGTHLADINLALGNLVHLTAFQSRAYGVQSFFH